MVSSRSARVDCFNCGLHVLTFEASAVLQGGNYDDQTLRAHIAYGVRKMPQGSTVTTHALQQLQDTTELPSALDQIDNLVLCLASRGRPGQGHRLIAADMLATLGAVTAEEAEWVMVQAQNLELVQGVRTGTTPGEAGGYRGAALTASGWQRHRELLQAGAASRHAFMAMKFGDPVLDSIFKDHLRKAVAAAGFELRTVAGDHRTAGSIDNRMRVEIRTSRFLVCDLTHGNRGAYWEAGFAEGLGRPVFYVCQRDVLADRNHPDHPHFDTAHQLITTWSPDTIEADMSELKAVIRNTLPAEATMQDLNEQSGHG